MENDINHINEEIEMRLHRSHINVEFCTTVQSVKYLFKYHIEGEDYSIRSTQRTISMKYLRNPSRAVSRKKYSHAPDPTATNIKYCQRNFAVLLHPKHYSVS